MSNAVATIDRPTKSVLVDMAARYGMEPAAFEATVRATVTPKDTSREEFAAFLLVAKEYSLNPLTKEIYAFPKRGGGIVPIVSIDGWVSLVNSHPACDGFEFEMEHDDKGALVACTCRMFRKDRGRPVVVTEYLDECVRPTDPWKMKHRMLRHKAMIQAARYAFGFSGIYDEDEGGSIAEARGVVAGVTPPPAPPSGRAVTTPPPAPKYAPASALPAPREQPQTFTVDQADLALAGEQRKDHGAAPRAASAVTDLIDPDSFLDDLDAALGRATTRDEIEDVWTGEAEPVLLDGALLPPDAEKAKALYAKHQARVEG